MKNRLLYLVLLIFLTAGMAGCGGASSGESATSDKTHAVSQSKTYSISVSSSTGGDVNPSRVSVAENEFTSFTVTPDSGFLIEQVSGCDGSLDESTYTTGVITKDCHVDAKFIPVLHSIGGVVSGLDGTLQLTGEFAAAHETAELTDDGSFSFAYRAQPDTSYSITISTPPAGQQCSISNGAGVVTSDISNIEIICHTLPAMLSVSGTIFPVTSSTTDSDINDISAPFSENSTTATAQALNHQAVLHGFASAEPTGGNTSAERFASSPDPDDFFQVTLEAGQIVQLQVVEHKAFGDNQKYGDLDLYLFDINHQLVGASEGSGEFEELTVPAAGDFFINVHAYKGISKYVLRLLPASANVSTVIAAPDFVANEMIVKYIDGSLGLTTNAKKTSRTLKGNSRRPSLKAIDPSLRSKNRALEAIKLVNPEAYAKVTTLRSIKKVRHQANVAYAEPNYIRQPLFTPNDPHNALQWHYPAIQLPTAWRTTTGETTTGNSTEQTVIVAVIDTGVALAHPDLSGQLISGYDFISDVNRARDGDGIDSDPNDPGDSKKKGQSSWHGTHVAGTIAAASDNGTGITGVAWGAQIMPIRVLGKGGGTSYDIIQGLRYAAGLANDSNTLPARRADIANLSFGGFYQSRAEQEAYQAAREAGVILVGAAGNAASSEPFYPAAYPEVISVSATDYANQLAPYSSFGSTVALAAPGGNNAADLNRDGSPDGILSAAVDDSRGALRYVYRFYSGTSMAAPHVTGVLALMKSVYAELTPDTVDALIHGGAVSDDLGVEGRDDSYGFGLINAAKAVSVAANLTLGKDLSTESPPLITVGASSVEMGFSSSASVTLSNQGGGDPVVMFFSSTADWLTVSPDSADSNGFGSYTLTVDRTALTAGSHQAEVMFDIENEATIVIPVTIQVDIVSNAGELTQLYVLLLDGETSEVVYTTTGQAFAGNVTYTFSQIPPGDYYVIAGSDIDSDGFTCQLGESCGGYPDLIHSRRISVNDSDVSEIDFFAEILNNFSQLASADILKKNKPQ